MVFSTTALPTVPPGFLLEGPATYHTLGADKLGELGSLAENGEYEDGASSVLRVEVQMALGGNTYPLISHTRAQARRSSSAARDSLRAAGRGEFREQGSLRSRSSWVPGSDL